MTSFIEGYDSNGDPATSGLLRAAIVVWSGQAVILFGLGLLLGALIW